MRLRGEPLPFDLERTHFGSGLYEVERQKWLARFDFMAFGREQRTDHARVQRADSFHLLGGLQYAAADDNHFQFGEQGPAECQRKPGRHKPDHPPMARRGNQHTRTAGSRRADSAAGRCGAYDRRAICRVATITHVALAALSVRINLQLILGTY